MRESEDGSDPAGALEPRTRLEAKASRAGGSPEGADLGLVRTPKSPESPPCCALVGMRDSILNE
jgi:hypothetical protein